MLVSVRMMYSVSSRLDGPVNLRVPRDCGESQCLVLVHALERSFRRERHSLNDELANRSTLGRASAQTVRCWRVRAEAGRRKLDGPWEFSDG